MKPKLEKSIFLEESILIDLTALLKNFNGREYSGAIGPDTFFFRDLEMASIDAVVLAEQLEQFYGQKFPFYLLFANEMKNKTKNKTKNFDIQLSELVQFLATHIKNKEMRFDHALYHS